MVNGIRPNSYNHEHRARPCRCECLAHCLVNIDINPEMRVKVAQGSTRHELVEQGRRTFLVKVQNEAGAAAELRVVNPNAESVHDSPSKRTAFDAYYRKRGQALKLLPVAQLWLDLETLDKTHREAITHTIQSPPVNFQFDLPLLELIVQTKAGIEALSAQAGLKIIYHFLEEEIPQRCGLHGEQVAYRHGHQPGYVI